MRALRTISFILQVMKKENKTAFYKVKIVDEIFIKFFSLEIERKTVSLNFVVQKRLPFVEASLDPSFDSIVAAYFSVAEKSLL